MLNTVYKYIETPRNGGFVYNRKLRTNYMMLLTLKINRAVNQCCSLELMLVVIFLFCEVFDEVYMLPITDINGAGGLSVELMEMLIGKVRAEFDLMEMVLCTGDIFGFSGHGAEAVIMTIIAFLKDFGAAGQFVDMLLLFVVIRFTHNGKRQRFFYTFFGIILETITCFFPDRY